MTIVSLANQNAHLAVDPSSADSSVENQFFAEGLKREANPQDHLDEAVFAEHDRRRRRQPSLWLTTGIVGLVAIGLSFVVIEHSRAQGAPKGGAGQHSPR